MREDMNSDKVIVILVLISTSYRSIAGLGRSAAVVSATGEATWKSAARMSTIRMITKNTTGMTIRRGTTWMSTAR